MLKWKSEDPLIFAKRANVYAKLGRWDRVQEDVRRAWQLAPDAWNDFYYLAFLDTGKDAIQPAMDLMTSRIEQQSDDDVAYVNRGQLYARLAQWDRAAEDFARARSTGPDNAWWRIGDGFAALKIGDEQRYRADCQQLLALARDNSQGDGLRGACVWMFNTRFRPIEDIPEIREFLQERLDELESYSRSNTTPPWTLHSHPPGTAHTGT